MELRFEEISPVLKWHPFFLFYAKVMPAAMRRICHQATSQMGLSPGDVLFSEPALWARGWHHVGSMSASTECLLTALHVTHLNDIATKFNPRKLDCPCCCYAEAFVDELNKVGAADVPTLAIDVRLVAERVFCEE